MLDFLFTLGQAASALLLIYGAYLVMLPARKPAAEPVLADRLLQTN
jgi:hypothetical protein